MDIFDFVKQDSQFGSGFVYKSNMTSFFYNGDYPVVIARNAIIRLASTPTATTTLTVIAVDKGLLEVGMQLLELGSGISVTSFGTFNGTSGTIEVSFPVIVPTQPSFKATDMANAANYPTETVRGVVYLDGTYYVMTPQGSIYGSAINNPLSWSALNVIQSQMSSDNGVCLTKQGNLILAFGENSSEFFYDAGNPVGSPLLPYSSSFLELGCAHANTVSQTDNSTFFIGVSKQKGRGLYTLEGTQSKYLSNPFIDRLLNYDDLVECTGTCLKLSGHTFYLLHLPTSNITLVYDMTSNEWATWTLSKASTPKTVTTGVSSGYDLTLSIPAHGYKDGDLVVLEGFTPDTIDDTYTINVLDVNSIVINTSLVPTVYGTAYNYVNEPFTIASYASGANLDMIQDSTTGNIYSLDNQTYVDAEGPIDVLLRTFKFDSGDNNTKFISALELIGDKVESTAYVRYTNDDYQTWSKYRPVNLNAQRSILNRLGKARRRAFEIRHHDNTPLRLEALELSATQGAI